MSTRRRTVEIILVILLAIAGLAGLLTMNLRFARQNPGGNDFLVHWVGTRSLLTEGVSPYSNEVAIRIQTRAYGRPAQPGEHELRVAYPLYSSIIFAPFAAISDYSLARALWMTLLEVCMVLTSIISMHVTIWKPGLLITFLFFMFSMTWYHGVRALINGNAIILVAFFMIGSLLAIRSNIDWLAGILLAFSTIKPQVVVLFVIFVLLWAISQKRWQIILWTLVSVLILTLLAILIIPDWIIQNFREVLRYPGYNPPGTPGAVFQEWWPAIGQQLGWALSIMLSIILLVEWRNAWGEGYRWLLWTSGLTIILSQWIGIQTDPGNFLTLIFPFVIVLAGLEQRWGQPEYKLITTLLIVFVGVSLWLIFLATIGKGEQPQQHPIMFFPLPLYLLIGIFYVRRWYIS